MVNVSSLCGITMWLITVHVGSLVMVSNGYPAAVNQLVPRLTRRTIVLNYGPNRH